MIPTHHARGSHIGHLKASNFTLWKVQRDVYTLCDIFMRSAPTRTPFGACGYGMNAIMLPSSTAHGRKTQVRT